MPRDGDEDECRQMKRDGRCGESDVAENCGCACAGEPVIEDDGGVMPNGEYDLNDGKPGPKNPVNWWKGLSQKEKNLVLVGGGAMGALVAVLAILYFCCCTTGKLNPSMSNLERKAKKKGAVQMNKKERVNIV